ncbi:MAG: TetR/AcrR family transcriptional regulator, tetracycline repressor protein [Actinomycetota bacterium]|nr:TetR/AcrR family transcriptional regulator, tetracycline repressor protein [Actinomycetota bacterium]
MGLHRDDIVETALVLLDERGLDRLTTRSVAERLGVRVSALYRHFRDKRELLAEMADRVLTGIRFLLPSGEGWERQLRDVAHRLRAALLAHRDGARLVTGFAAGTSAVLRLAEGCLGILHCRGVPLPAAVYAGNAVLSFVSGFVLREQNGTCPWDGLPGSAHGSVHGPRAVQGQVPATSHGDSPEGTPFPLLSRWAVVQPSTGDLAFATGLDHLLMGIRVRLFDDPDPRTA